MKAGFLAIAAAVAVGVNAKQNHAARRHAHQAFHLERGLMATGTGSPETCGCTTIYTTITGEGTLYNPPAPATTAPSSSIAISISTSSVAAVSSTSTASTTSTISTPPAPVVTIPTSTKTPEIPVPTPLASTCPTPGVYTIPATTVTITASTTVCGAATTSVPAGEHTYGGVVTVVETATTVVCPYATVSTNSGVVTSVIETTTYVCPSAGTYTIAPSTTSVSTATVLVYPTPATFTPGTYTQTNYVIFCPLTASSAAPAPTTPAAAPVVVSSPAPVVVASSPPAVVVASAPPAKSVSVVSSSTPGQLGSSGNQWAMTYTPYTKSGECKSASSVMSDIAVIKAAGFSVVRVYSTDCSGLTNIGAACEASGLRMIVGVFISSTGLGEAAEQVSDIISWGKFSLVDLIVIGNEAVFNGYCSASALASFITDAKSKFAAAGYSGQCTTTEPLNTWQANSGALCGAVDVVGCNIHPFFNADVEASGAGPFVKSQLDIVDGLCPGKTGINLETGWPSAGKCNGKACPGPEAQAVALKSIAESVGGKSVMFSYVDDPWKPAGEFGCEQHWGAVHVF
ncbi:putative beta-glucosidase btgE [Glarea lozoyensis 74030]|uniref:Probable beta-glucosidase btgE n=1 Tax=Glarea lozoyensis (strain ATCC 74030 / MF5533) TaxID=1104152 RepID=H0EDU0_GLAL7|nr:putative beta-glucosidase btgE [Glarea lozoyensis 74030]